MCLSLVAVAKDDSDTNNSVISIDAQSINQSDWQTRSTLSGDWNGARTNLANNGVSFDLRSSSFYQGLAAGTGTKSYQYGGKIDAFINFDSQKMGLWQGGGFRSHIEYSYGDAPTNLGGAIFAINTALYWPVDSPEQIVATSLYFTQKLGEKSSIAVGKFNPVDLLAQDPFYGGWGIDRFMNLILAAPPSGLIPVVFMGAVANVQTKPINWTFMVFDPNDRTNDYFPNDLFDDGINFAVTGAYTTTLAGRKTSYAINGLYSTAEGVDYTTLPLGFETTNKKGSYSVSLEFKHILQQSKTNPSANWGFYSKIAVADGNPNYVESSIIVGIAGKALFFNRPQDSFGLGLYRYNLSDDLQDSLEPFSQFKDESAIELFYSYALAPWLLFGPNIQIIDPASGGNKNAVVLGLRFELKI